MLIMYIMYIIIMYIRVLVYMINISQALFRGCPQTEEPILSNSQQVQETLLIQANPVDQAALEVQLAR